MKNKLIMDDEPRPTNCYLCDDCNKELCVWLYRSTYICSDCCHQINKDWLDADMIRLDLIYNIVMLSAWFNFQNTILYPQFFKLIDKNKKLLADGGRDAWKSLKDQRQVFMNMAEEYESPSKVFFFARTPERDDAWMKEIMRRRT